MIRLMRISGLWKKHTSVPVVTVLVPSNTLTPSNTMVPKG